MIIIHLLNFVVHTISLFVIAWLIFADTQIVRVYQDPIIISAQYVQLGMMGLLALCFMYKTGVDVYQTYQDYKAKQSN